MTDHEASASDGRGGGTLDAVRRQRHGVRSALDDLERAVAAPSAGRAKDWAAAVGRRVEDLRSAFAEHIDVTERDGGLFDEVVGQAPRLANKVHKLRDEHVTISGELGTLTASASGCDADSDVAGLRDGAVGVMGRLVRHRSEGSDLIYEAYFVDIDAAD